MPVHRSSIALGLVAAVTLGTLGAAVSAGSAGVPACDDRISIADPARFPFNTICEISWPAAEPGFIAIGSGALISRHAVLTNGHVVYDRDGGGYVPDVQQVAPAAFRDGSMVFPYGTRDVSLPYKATNSKWADPTYPAPVDVDYGCLKIVCPFVDLTTFMPLRFDYSPSVINVSGYPVADLPPSGDSRDQWRGADVVTSVLSRSVTYDQRSTGGASGSPVWIYNAATDERSIVAVNRGHSTDCNGVGPRLVWNNEGLIRDWMNWTPSLAERLEAGCAFDLTFEPIPWPHLFEQLAQLDQWLTPVADLRLVDPIVPPPAPPAARIMQVIEGTFYEWLEFTPDENDPEAPRFLRMVSPEPKWLSVPEARVLLSASARLVQEVPFGESTTFGPVVPSIGIDPAPAELVNIQDGVVDRLEEAGRCPCPADLNGDGAVDFDDLVLMLSVFGGEPGTPGIPASADLDADGTLGFGDVLGILAAWGPCDC